MVAMDSLKHRFLFVFLPKPGSIYAFVFGELTGVVYFDANGILVESYTTAIAASASVPGHPVERKQLHYRVIAAYHQMGGYLALWIAKYLDSGLH